MLPVAPQRCSFLPNRDTRGENSAEMTLGCEAGGEDCCQPSRRLVFSNLYVFTPTEEVVGLILNKITQDAMSGF